MRTTFVWGMAAVAVAQSIPPAEFGLPTAENNTQLGVAFDAAQTPIVVQPGALFGKQITMTQPNIAIDGKNSQTLAKFTDDGGKMLVVMVDPDAPSPDAPTAAAILHWMAADLSATTAAQDFGALQGQSVLASTTPNAVPFAPPGPPATSSAHRYLLFLFQQPDNFAVPAEFAQFNAQNRANFDLKAFVAAAGLGAPLAANFMFVSGQDAVPADFQGAPFTEFPGGNGNAVGLPGSTATPAAAPEAPPPPPAASGAAAGESMAGGVIQGAVGEMVMGMGVQNANGLCSCDVTCPAGSFVNIVVTT